MKVLVVGGGGREHALVWKLSQSKHVDALFCAPGNGGIAEIAECINIDTADIEGIIAFAKKERIGLLVVGPENPLALGIADAFEHSGIPVFGPTQKGALMETSKIFAKELMGRHNISTASFRVFSDYADARSYVDALTPPFVIKADGLCAGKGAYVITDEQEPDQVLRELMINLVYGDAGKRVIVEEFLPGVEASYIAFTDGKTILPMLPSQDHKALLDGDEGPNTGGMGAYTPIPFISNSLEKEIDKDIMLKTVEALRAEGVDFRGVLYGGLMLNDDKPYVLEFNARMGDPETQPLLFKMKSDLFPILLACAQGDLGTLKSIEWHDGVSVCVVLASKGYPESPEKGQIISGLENIKGNKDVMVFHAATRKVGKEFVTSGGRVLGVTALGDNYEDAIKKAYEAVSRVDFKGMQYRHDIGSKALKVVGSGPG